MDRYPHLFSPVRLGSLDLKNRISMAPLYLGYPDPDNRVNDLTLEHYAEMAASGAGLIVVENVGVGIRAIGSPRTMLINSDDFIPGLTRLAATIKDKGPAAILQLNQAGRFAYATDRFAPSALPTWGVTPRAMTRADMDRVRDQFADAASRAKASGFDGVELHGGTGYLLAQYLSPRTNLRNDEYGGCLENRMRFPLEVVRAVIERVGADFAVGYRFLADELLPGGFGGAEALAYASELGWLGVSYLSVMAGTYESFATPEYQAAEKTEGFMADYARAVKEAVPGLPVIAAGRIQTPEYAESVIAQGVADLIGLARVLYADPRWPLKAAGLDPEPIVACEPTCNLCLKRVMAKKPAMCSRWGKERIRAFRARLGEADEE